MSDAKISIASDTRAAAAGIKSGVIEPLEDAVDALEKVGREGDDAGEALERAMRDAQRESRELGDEFSKTAREISSSSKQASYRVKQDMSESTSAAKRDLNELKDEGIQNASETLSSFDGSVESFADGIQGTLGGVVSNMGPLGAALGAGGALAVGLFMAEFQRAEEKAQALRERVAEVAQEMIDAGSSDLGLEVQLDTLRQIVAETEDARTTMRDLIDATDFADLDGLDIGPLARAMAGDLDMVDRQLAQVEETLTGIQSVGYENYDAELAAQQQRLEGIRDDLIEVRDSTVEAQEAYDAWVAAGGPEMQARQDAIAAYASSVQESLADAGAAWEEFYDTETGALDIGGYIAAFEQRAAAIEGYQANVTTASQTLNQQALNYISSLGTEAAPLLQAYIDAPLEEQQRLEGIWTTLGNAAGTSYATQLQNSIPESVEGPVIVPSVSTAAAQAELDRFRRQTLVVQANVRVQQTGQRIV